MFARGNWRGVRRVATRWSGPHDQFVIYEQASSHRALLAPKPGFYDPIV